jgi:acyl-CoA thioester hydrolase
MLNPDRKIEERSAELPLVIRTYDIDIAGHVNNIVYVRWIEDLRCSFFAKYLSIDFLMKKNLYPVVIKTNVSYKRQLKMQDNPHGIINLKFVKHGIIGFSFLILNENCTFAYAEQNCVLMNLLTGKMDKDFYINLV